jgi:acetyl-CoA carboxylase carboxyltransferase component
VIRVEPGQQYDMTELLGCLVDANSMDEYRAEFGQSLVCGYARIGGFALGIVANQKKLTQKKMAGGKAGPSVATNMPAPLVAMAPPSITTSIFSTR